jgi:dipeptidyl aminopeptidase/acylaminoacyl peptidase
MRKFLLLMLLPCQWQGQAQAQAPQTQAPQAQTLQVQSPQAQLTPFKMYPFPTQLVAAGKGSKLAWALDEQGKRNVYVAEGPGYTPRKLTHFSKDDGQELTSLSISDDGKWVVFVRGGDHGGNWDIGLPTDPGFDAAPFKVQIASVPFDGGEPKYLSEGDNPIISPDGKRVAFIKDGQAWACPLDASVPAKRLFTARGTIGSLEWAPDGSSLLFEAGREDHSIIGIYTDSATPLRWIAPSFSDDNSPHWSPDGHRVVFVRRPGEGGSPDSLLVKKHAPWSIYVADIGSGKTTLVWKAPVTPSGSYPSTDGGANLHWAAGNKIVFLSYQDGWPHLYSIDAGDGTASGTVAVGGKEKLLTPGPFMCEFIRLSADKKFLVFNANTGTDKLDIDRRHVVLVNIQEGGMQVLTAGDGLEWAPVLTGDGSMLAFIRATAQQCPIPAVMPLTQGGTGKGAGGQDNGKIRLMGADLVPAAFLKEKLITPRQVIFQSGDGMTLHGELFLPEAGAPKKPAIVYVHGGPPRQMLLGWNYSDYYSNAYASNQYLASLGFVVLAVNYRLGIGYGYDFQQPAHAGLWGASEYQDIKAAGEWLQKQDFVDGHKIGIYGGSYGGYLTALALARDSKIFAAGVDIHGVHDWVVNSSILRAFNDKYEKAPDYDMALKTAWLSSPVSSIDTWTSPVLIIHADDDRNVRFNQSTDLIVRLEKKGVPHETLMIVDDTHHMMRWENAVAVYGAVADFFVRKLK